MTRARDVSSRGGLTQVIPTSVAVGSGSASVGANGGVTFTGATSVSLNGCFTANYDNYRIIIDSFASSVDGTNPYFRVRSSGSDISLTNYYHAGRRMISWGGASSDMLSAGVNYFSGIEANNDTNTYRNYILDVQNPFKSTNVTMLFNTATQVGGSYYGTGIYFGMYRANTSVDGISLILSTATSGIVRAYGYNNG
jgi:hypothetical protein